MQVDEFLTCPYEKSHRVKRSRMLKHLTKCEKSHPDLKLKTCVYNSLHRIYPLDYEHHIEVCESKSSTDLCFVQTESLRLPKCITIEEINSIQCPIPTENWDKEIPVETYDPMKAIEEKNILRSIQVASKAKKKQFKQRERERHSILDSTANTSLQTMKDTTVPISSDELEKPLRLPRHLPQAIAKTKPGEYGLAAENKETVEQESKYMDEDLIFLRKTASSTSNNASTKNISKEDAAIVKPFSSSNNNPNINTRTVRNNIAAMLNIGIYNIRENSTNSFPNELQRNCEKRCSVGRGISKMYEAYKKSGISKENFKSHFMNPKNDVESLEKNSEYYGCGYGTFVGCTDEETDLNLKDIEDELNSIGRTCSN